MPDGSEVPMPEVDGCVGVNIRPDGYKVVPVDASELTFRRFLYVAQVAAVVKDGMGLVAKPLAPPVFEEVAG
jgi:hypothetical protein